jgi:hypothetical protein
MKNPWLAALVMLLVSGSGFCADDPPRTMIHVIVQLSGTDIPEGSFAGKPKTLWRATNSYCRSDEEPDPAQGLHLSIIMNEPDSWLVDLANNRAKHMVDPGPTFNCRLPIFAFSMELLKSKVGGLEYGHELEFFQKNGAKQVDGPELKSFKANYYEVALDGMVLKLVERVDIHAPILISLLQGEKVTSVRYLLWEDQIPFKADLFAKPTGVSIEEVK